MKDESKSIAIAGLGYWGKNLLRVLHQLGILHSACDADQEVISRLKHEYPDVSFTDSIKELMAESSIKGLVIATPAVTHYKLVKEALLAQKDVFVEKPLSLSVKEGEELVRLAEKENKVLMVGHTLQYHPAVVELKELIAKGDLGKIQYVYSNRLNIGKLRSEENILWSFAPHDISVILMLLEEMPIRVAAFGEDYLSKGIYDTTLTNLEFSSGVKGHIYVSWLHPYKEQRLVIVGTKAMAVFDDVSEEKLCIYPHKIEWKNGKTPVAHKAEYISIDVTQGEPLKLEMEHFIECINTRNKPKTDGYEGLRVLQVLQSMEDSLSNNAFIKLNELGQDVYIHESAYIDDDVSIGSGTKIWHYSHILKGSNIGKNCTVGQNVMVGPDAIIGDGCKIQNNVSVYKGVTLEADVFCGPSCVFTNVNTPRSFIDRKDSFSNTLVKKGASIGANATIICGVTIGRYALVGAGAVVKHDVPDYAVVAGVPAIRIGWACECGTVIKSLAEQGKLSCNICGATYLVRDGNLSRIEES